MLYSINIAVFPVLSRKEIFKCAKEMLLVNKKFEYCIVCYESCQEAGEFCSDLRM